MGIILANIIAIYRRELQSYFASPFAYAIAGIFWILSGFFFVAILMAQGGLLSQVAMRDQMGITDPPIDVAYEFLNAFLGVLASIALFILPVLSMGLYTEERKRGTLELLATSPVTNWAVALGKLLAVVTFFLTMVLPLLVYESVALGASDPPVQPAVFLLGHLGLVLLAAAVLSLGMFISSLTDSTILAAILTFALVLFLWVIDLVASSISGPVGEALNHLSLLKSYGNFTQGILDSSSVIVFLSYIALGLFLTAQSVEAFRFQRS
ncbi:ABC transporter permease [Phormidium tenue FACHB-886]|nr:ABC transporter permease [Phormidium tenue FACHB-886]